VTRPPKGWLVIANVGNNCELGKEIEDLCCENNMTKKGENDGGAF
jgi:hypothetical protein